jgi:hypothetical protein
MRSPITIYIRCAVERIHGVAPRLATLAAVAAVSCQSIASYHTADCRVEDCWYATFYSVDIGMGRCSRCSFYGGHWLEIATADERTRLEAAMSVRYARKSGFGRCGKSLIEVCVSLMKVCRDK